MKNKNYFYTNIDNIFASAGLCILGINELLELFGVLLHEPVDRGVEENGEHEDGDVNDETKSIDELGPELTPAVGRERELEEDILKEPLDLEVLVNVENGRVDERTEHDDGEEDEAIGVAFAGEPRRVRGRRELAHAAA